MNLPCTADHEISLRWLAPLWVVLAIASAGIGLMGDGSASDDATTVAAAAPAPR